jgi:2'-5' RNA ligase
LRGDALTTALRLGPALCHGDAMRLFAAIRPPQNVIDHLAVALADAQSFAPDLRWVEPGQWHITLAFYGEQPSGALEDIAAQLANVAAESKPHRLHLRGCGTFGGRTLWIGLGGTDLRKLMAAAELDDVDPGRQRAHLTVARAPRQVGVAKDLARALTVYTGPEWTATELELVESVLGAGRGGRPLHDTCRRFRLGTC